MLRLAPPLLLSLLLHAGLGVAFLAPSPAAPAPLVDRWAGSGEGVEVVEFADPGGPTPPPGAAALPGEPGAGALPGGPVAPEAPAPAVLPAAPDVAPAPRAARDAPRTEPRPRPRRRRPRPRPPGDEPAARAAASSGGGGPAASAAPAGPGAGPGGAPGMAGLPPGVRPLDGAFARALAYTAAGVKGWNALDAGTTQTAEVEFVVGDDGKLVDIVARGPVAELRAAAERTRHLLQSGTFALRADAVEPGRRVYRLTLRFSQAEATDETWSDADHATGIGFEAPTEARPGRAEFTLRSGRRVTITVARAR